MNYIHYMYERRRRIGCGSFTALLLVLLCHVQVGAQNRVLLNGGFETPVLDSVHFRNFVSSTAPATIIGPRMDYWSSSSFDYLIEVRQFVAAISRGELSAVGQQHVEVSGTNRTRVYQNTCLIQGETIAYSFYHKGRAGVDTLQVGLFDDAGTNKIAILQTVGTGALTWQQYSGTHTVAAPTGNYQFSFEALFNAGGKGYEGNFLDEVELSIAPLITISKPAYLALENTLSPPTLKVNGKVPAGGITVTLSSIALGALAGTDYTFANTVTIPPGIYTPQSDSFPIAFQVLNDDLMENNEQVTFTLQSATNGGLLHAGCGGYLSTTYTILNDDVFEAGPPRLVCPEETVTLTAVKSESPTWNNGVLQGVPLTVPKLPGVYLYIAKDTSYSEPVAGVPFFLPMADTVVVTVKSAPLPLTRDIDTCQQNTSFPLTAAGNALVWYTDTLLAGSTSAPLLDLNTPDTMSLWVSSVNAGCESDKKEMKIAVKVTPPAPLVRDSTLCQQVGNITLSAIGTQLSWYTLPFGGSASSIAPSFNTNLPDTLSTWASQTLNGCEGPRGEIKLSIKTLPPMPSARDTALCEQTGNLALQAIGTDLKWYDESDNEITAPVVPLPIPDTLVYRVSQTMQLCEGPIRTVKVSIKALPPSPLVSDTSICQKTGSLSFKAKGQNLLWYPSGSPTGTSSIPFVNSFISQTTTYFVSQSVQNCEGPKAALSIEIRPVPTAPLVTDQVVCESAGAMGYLVTGSNLKWYPNQSNTTFSTTAPLLQKNNIGTHSVFPSQTLNNCEGPRKEVTITIHPLPLAPAVSNFEYCLHDKVSPLTTLQDSLFWYTVAAGGTPSSIKPVATSQAVGITSYWVSAVKKGCEGPRSNLTINVHGLPVVKINGITSGNYCAKSSLALNATGTPTYDWTLPSGLHSSLPSLFIPSFGTNDIGKYLLTGTDGNQCQAKDSILLSLKNPPPVSAEPITICEKSPLLVKANTTGVAYWRLPDKTIQNSATLSIPVSKYSDHGIYIVASTLNGCTDSTEVMISVLNCKPIALDDYYSMYADEKLLLDDINHPTNNDNDPNDKLLLHDLVFLTMPSFGQLTSNGYGLWTYAPTSDVEGKEVIEYRICDRGTPTLCSTAKIEIEIKKRSAFFPDAFTPNGDGINDTYTVYQLSPNVNVELNVYNRWGDLVYQNNDYKNDWKGTCSSTLCNGSGPLPVGTYFIVAQLSTGEKYSTYLTLNR